MTTLAGPTRPRRLDAVLRDPAVRRRLGRRLAAFTVAAMLLATLYPFRFQLGTASWARIDWRLTYPGHADRDLLLNLLVLVPLGAGFALARFDRARLWPILLQATALGFGLALFVETVQISEPTRDPQAADVWRNTVGCAAGAIVTTLLLRAFARKPGR